MAKNNRGGKRKGAGRPPLQVRRIYVTLTDAQVEWLKAQGNASKAIRDIIEQHMNPPQ